MLRVISIATYIILSLVPTFAQQPKVISEKVFIDGQWATVTQKSSTEVKHTTVIEFISDTAIAIHKRLQLKPVVGGKITNEVIDFYSRSVFRGNIDFITPGEYVISGIDINKDEVAEITIKNSRDEKTFYDFINYDKRKTMRKVVMPADGLMVIVIKKASKVFINHSEGH